MKPEILRALFPMALTWKINKAMQQLAAPARAVESFAAAYLKALVRRIG